MSKKAFLVSFSPMTRVVVDVEEKEGEDVLDDPYQYAKIIREARAQIVENGIDEYLNGDSLDQIVEDIECPYTEEEDEE